MDRPTSRARGGKSEYAGGAPGAGTAERLAGSKYRKFGTMKDIGSRVVGIHVTRQHRIGRWYAKYGM